MKKWDIEKLRKLIAIGKAKAVVAGTKKLISPYTTGIMVFSVAKQDEKP